MKNFIFLIICFIGLSCSNQSEDFDLLISNVNLIDGTGNPMRKGVNVYINNGRIEKIDSVKTKQTENVIDGTDKYMIPGLFDCHIHTTDYHQDFSKLMHYGVTSVFIPGGSLCTNEYFAAMRSIGNQNSIPAPRVYHTSQHFTMEGRHPVKTYASSNWREGETVFFLKDTSQIAQLVKEVAQYPIMGIKMGTLNAARMMQAQDSLGSIEPGKLADLIILDANPLASISNTLKINTVIKYGAKQKRKSK